MTITSATDYKDKVDAFAKWAKQFYILEKKPKGSRNKKKYVKYFATADFETTNDDETQNSFVYSWAFCFKYKVIVGRTLQSFMYFLARLTEDLDDKCMIIYFHNLSFDITFIQGVWHFGLEDCFCMDSRKFLRAYMGDQFELRCSYLLTNMSLSMFTKEMKVKHRKLLGEKFDYSIYRTPAKALKRYELNYIINDVLGQYEALCALFSIGDGNGNADTVYTVPLTSTGYVRRDIKKALTKLPYSKRKEWQLDYEAYKACKEAMRGGNTHGSRFYSDTILSNVNSNDFASAYPSAMIFSDRFPKRNFYRKGAISLNDFYYFRKHNCMIVRVRFWNLRLHDQFEACPYLSLSKVRNEKRVLLDNGRILECAFCETTMTDLDVLTTLEQYDYDEIEIYDSFMCACGRLPDCIRELVLEWFKKKSALKGVEGQELLLANVKAKLNAIFGCSCMDPCKALLLYDDQTQEFNFSEEFTEAELLERYNKKGFMPYSVGIFVTAICRRMLQDVMNIIPKSAWVYSDTDSCKYLGDHHIFDEYNRKQIELCEKEGVYAYNKKGEKKFLGTFDFEEQYSRYVEMGAKKYAYEDEEGQLHLTCAGVHKTKGAYELIQHGGLEAFKDGFVFKLAGGTQSVYNDFSNFDIERNGEKIHVTKNIYITDSEYTLGRTADYLKVIEMARQIICNNLDDGFDVGYNNMENII